MPDIELSFFGPPHIAIDGLPVPTQRRKSLALLAYLAVTQQGHARYPDGHPLAGHRREPRPHRAAQRVGGSHRALAPMR